MTDQPKSRPWRSLKQELDDLWSFIEGGCDARPEDKHHALQCLDSIKALFAVSESEPRKVFVVIGGWDYEGYSEPTGIYDSRVQAEGALEHARKEHSYDTLVIMEYDLNNGERERSIAP